MKRKIGIVGATGYTGVELLRLLVSHPDVEISYVTSREHAGSRVDAMFPNLRGYVDLEFSAPSNEALSGCDLVFFATPNGIAMKSAQALLDAGAKVIDLAADFRIKDIAVWEKWYGMQHASPHLVEEAVYGLPELNRAQIREARLVANPGCYPTAVTLGLLPLVEKGLVDLDHIIADTKSGASGAGRKAEVHTLLAEAGDNFKAYAASGHRHQPEIAQTLSMLARQPINPVFVPHLLPMIRGIHATLYALLTAEVDLQQLYQQRYADEPFVDVLPAGAHPETRSVRGANFCRIALHRPGNGVRVVVLSVIDNLVKGAAGQAVQNMNLMLGLAEEAALKQPGLLP
ncbi:N-acetyl-gamma-glutamyl-phosphate reductase [Candidatus Thiothrix sp. Deng01]|uniref:N-acetyl-gamma-glutamyl-phosphate reductase n=1 Tax=Candidatus Thiothrix phosphatis TaxID=3112415 RepID=A0ABU6CWH1_9GAMM|nr:N-acetyl-gamma-glutamyl-phosphate reductase [Candidatus Thiothrix sp. Deng01]MEB4591191.1 N-acetyl-gamma-glutamyl-phosphate reductase [Candidatus Thiothrix sp. Deng01]